MRNTCSLCEAREHVERAALEDWDGTRDRAINVCECGGVKRFIAYGTIPTTPHQADKFISMPMDAFGLKKKRGRKKKTLTSFWGRISEPGAAMVFKPRC